MTHGVIGNTPVFGSGILGSSPSGSTKASETNVFGAFLVIGGGSIYVTLSGFIVYEQWFGLNEFNPFCISLIVGMTQFVCHPFRVVVIYYFFWD